MRMHRNCRGGALSPPEFSIRDHSVHGLEFIGIHSIGPIESSFHCGRTRWSAPTILIALFLLVPPAQAASLLSSLDCWSQGCALDGVYGDTYIFTAWGPNGRTAYNGVTVPGMIYGTYNDGSCRVCMAQGA